MSKSGPANLAVLVLKLRRQGVVFDPTQNPPFSGPSKALTPDVVQTLDSHRAQLLQMLDPERRSTPRLATTVGRGVQAAQRERFDPIYRKLLAEGQTPEQAELETVMQMLGEDDERATLVESP